MNYRIILSLCFFVIILLSNNADAQKLDTLDQDIIYVVDSVHMYTAKYNRTELKHESIVVLDYNSSKALVKKTTYSDHSLFQKDLRLSNTINYTLDKNQNILKELRQRGDCNLTPVTIINGYNKNGQISSSSSDYTLGNYFNLEKTDFYYTENGDISQVKNTFFYNDSITKTGSKTYKYDELNRLVKITSIRDNKSIMTELYYQNDFHSPSKILRHGKTFNLRYNQKGQLTELEIGVCDSLTNEFEVEKTTSYSYDHLDRLFKILIIEGQNEYFYEYVYEGSEVKQQIHYVKEYNKEFRRTIDYEYPQMKNVLWPPIDVNLDYYNQYRRPILNRFFAESNYIFPKIIPNPFKSVPSSYKINRKKGKEDWKTIKHYSLVFSPLTKVD